MPISGGTSGASEKGMPVSGGTSGGARKSKDKFKGNPEGQGQIQGHNLSLICPWMARESEKLHPSQGLRPKFKDKFKDKMCP